ncbi:MAG: hypothetical protein P8Z30_14005 [Acidobacteriota bacterium]
MSDLAGTPDEEAQKDELEADEGFVISHWPQTEMPDAAPRQIPPSRMLLLVDDGYGLAHKSHARCDQCRTVFYCTI